MIVLSRLVARRKRGPLGGFRWALAEGRQQPGHVVRRDAVGVGGCAQAPQRPSLIHKTPGAFQLYESRGFQVTSRVVTWRTPLA
jgi:hypothetical protein